MSKSPTSKAERVRRPAARASRAAALLCVAALALSWAACRCDASKQSASAGAGASLPTLTHVEEFGRLSQDELKRGYPVSLRAVVTYHDRGWRVLFIQDSTAGISLAAPDEDFDARVGQGVSVEGFTGGGFAPNIVRPRVRVVGASPPPALLHFAVSDTGVGIPEEKRAVIFDPFSQADSTTTRRYGGTGLGLSICSRLVGMMGGTIRVESLVGRGSTSHFTARFGLRPDATAETSAPAPPEHAPHEDASREDAPHEDARGAASPPEAERRDAAATFAAPLRILLAEDNEVNQRLAVRMLEKQGHAVTVACNGVEALAELERQAFDLVLMDVQMPEMGGLEATAALRLKEEGTGLRLPVIAMTAHAMKGDRERCLAAGMDGYISKPIRARRLAEEVARLAPSPGIYSEGQIVCAS